MMALNIPVGQFVGGLVEACLWLTIGIYLAWIRPWRLRRTVARERLDDEEIEAKLRKAPPKLGFVLLLIGVFQIITQLDQAGVWQLSTAGGIVLLIAGVGGAVFGIRQMRRAHR
jgi:protein-S-isoprenylcysteine O-methyltransferase Ste14